MYVGKVESRRGRVDRPPGCEGTHDVNHVLVAALGYIVRGWSIIPVRPKSKRPSVPWKAYQSQPATEQEALDWYADNANLGIAVICGKVSGGLTCRDFDTKSAYERWKMEHSDLAQMLPTVQTARGWHVYFRCDPIQLQQASKAGIGGIIKFGDGEIRGEGAYCIIPPSIHPTGEPYQWTVPLPTGEVPFVDLYTAGFLPDNAYHSADGVAQSVTENHSPPTNGFSNQCSQYSQSSLCHSVPLCVTPVLQEQIERAIASTLPRMFGKRNQQVFAFARALKGIPELAHAELSELKRFVRDWHERARPHLSTKPFEDTWVDFINGWPNVKFPGGTEPAQQALNRALANPFPAAALEYDSTKCRQLVALCRELQRTAGTDPFYLSCRKAETLLDIPYKTANNWLKMFVADRILEVAKLGDESGKATRFRYLREL